MDLQVAAPKFLSNTWSYWRQSKSQASVRVFDHGIATPGSTRNRPLGLHHTIGSSSLLVDIHLRCHRRIRIRIGSECHHHVVRVHAVFSTDGHHVSGVLFTQDVRLVHLQDAKVIRSSEKYTYRAVFFKFDTTFVNNEWGMNSSPWQELCHSAAELLHEEAQQGDAHLILHFVD